MSKNIEKCIHRLNFISSIKNPKLRQKILNLVADECLYKALNEIAVNVVEGPLNERFDEPKKINLKKFKKKFQNLYLGHKQKKKRLKIVKQTGGFWQFLIPVALETITSLIK